MSPCRKWLVFPPPAATAAAEAVVVAKDKQPISEELKRNIGKGMGVV